MNRRELMQWSALELALVGPLATVSDAEPVQDAAAHKREHTPGAEQPIPLDLRQVPLSFCGSYLTLSVEEGLQAATPLRLSTVRKTAVTYRYQTGAWSHELMSIGPAGPVEGASCAVTATSAQAQWQSDRSSACVAFVDSTSLRLTVQRGDVSLVVPRSFGWCVQQPTHVQGFDGASGYVMDVAWETAAQVQFIRGKDREELTVRAGLAPTTVLLSMSLLDEPTARSGSGSPQQTFDGWMERCPVFATDTTPSLMHATRVAWFLFWNLQVTPAGAYSRQAILSSKRSLSQVWSWDNLFNAMAIVQADPELAWGQLLLVLRHQLASGMLPDTLSDLRATYGYTKPPLWGWAVKRLLLHTPPHRHAALVGHVYPALVKLHRWWLRERDLRGNGVPCYLCGNDSGWDNSSIFDSGTPVQSPDLLALLILNAEGLAHMALLLGKTTEATAWKAEAATLLRRFEQTFVQDDRLVYFAKLTAGWQARHSTSLLTRIPILLGTRLSPAVRKTLIAELADPDMFAAPSGPASEALNSPLYEPNGYWRGPVWGPSTLLIVAGLHSVGEPLLARTLGDRYRAVCARKASFRENYDAKTGEGYFDSGMTWSAADYLLLGSAPGTLDQGSE